MKPINFIILGMIILLEGCIIFKPSIKEDSPVTEIGARGDSQPGNGYYLFLEARLHRHRGEHESALDLMQQAMAADPHSMLLKRELALWLWQSGDARGAMEILESVVAQHNDDSQALMMLGQLQQRQKQPAAAKASFEQALRHDPDNEDLYHLLGEIYLELEQLDEAQKAYETLVSEFPESYVGYFYLGQIHSVRNNFEQAATFFRRTISLAPELEEPRLELAEVYVRLGKWKEARQLYQGLLEGNPDHLRAQLGLGVLLQKMDDAPPSQVLFKRLAQRCDSQPEVLKLIFQQFWDREQFEVGLDVFAQIGPYLTLTSDHHYWQGLLHEALKSPDQAIVRFREVSDTSEYFSKAVVHGAYLLQETGRAVEAIAALQQAIVSKPDNPEFYLYLAGIFEDQKDYQSALDAVNKGLAVDEKNARLLFRLGVVTDKLGRKAETIAAMEAVIGLEPENATALNYLGYTYADLGENLDKAETYIREALKYKPDDGYITDSLGWVYYQRGQYAEALEILLKASELAPDDPIILEHVGDAYLKVSDHEKALLFYRRSLEKNPEERENLRQKIQDVLQNNS